MKTAELKIDSINCSHCVKSVTDALKELNGISSVKVSLENKKAVVLYDETKTNTDKMIEALKEIDFKAYL